MVKLISDYRKQTIMYLKSKNFSCENTFDFSTAVEE